MLPGDYVAYRLTGEICTTKSGLSEGIFWDYQSDSVSEKLLNYFGFDASLLPDLVPAFSIQGKLKPGMAQRLGVDKNAVIACRAGDQPNNAFSLNVVNPGEVAATAGTSGVIYGVNNQFGFSLWKWCRAYFTKQEPGCFNTWSRFEQTFQKTY